jgi:type II secretory pathway pseudopilin PulG
VTGRRGGSAAGVTLIELLVVLGLVGMLLGMALAATEWTLPSWQVRQTAGRVASYLRIARTEAVSRRVAVSVDFDLADGEAALVVDEAGVATRVLALGPAVAFVDPGGGDAITFETPGTGDAAALFNPRGQLLSLARPGHVHLGNVARGLYMRVGVSVVGAVSVETWDGSAWR